MQSRARTIAFWYLCATVFHVSPTLYGRIVHDRVFFNNPFHTERVSARCGRRTAHQHRWKTSTHCPPFYKRVTTRWMCVAKDYYRRWLSLLSMPHDVIKARFSLCRGSTQGSIKSKGMSQILQRHDRHEARPCITQFPMDTKHPHTHTIHILISHIARPYTMKQFRDSQAVL